MLPDSHTASLSKGLSRVWGNSYARFLGGWSCSDALRLPDQVLESKARFIAQIMTNRLTARSADDIEGMILTYAEVKALASGNPLVMEKFKVDLETKRIETLLSQYRHEKYRMEAEITHLECGNALD